MLAYVFWHWKADSVEAERYELDPLDRAAVSPPQQAPLDAGRVPLRAVWP